jgi:hypothetical protein
VAALIFEPRSLNTYLELDGEVLPSNSPLYIEVHRGLASVIINPVHPEEPAAAQSRALSRASSRREEQGFKAAAARWIKKCCG